MSCSRCGKDYVRTIANTTTLCTPCKVGYVLVPVALTAQSLRPAVDRWAGMDPDLFCIKCKGRGFLQFAQLSGGVQQPDKKETYKCMACNMSGIAPIPLCELNNES